MDSITIDQDLTVLAGHLVATGKEETTKLENLKSDLSTALNAGDYRVNRREAPFISSQTPLSVPAWAAGQQIVRTAGPFIDGLGKQFWYDFYRIKKQLKVARKVVGNVFLSIPVDDTLLFGKAGQSFHLMAGSVWCISNHLCTGAPAGNFTGLTIRSGKISFQGNFSISGDTILIGENDTCRLELELAQPAVTADSSSNTGNDAKILDLILPGSVVMNCNPGNVVLSGAPKMSVTLYGSKYTLPQASRPNRFETVLNRILIPFDNDKNTLEIVNCSSPFIKLEKSAPLTESAWALPVTQSASIDQLGDAAGIGAIALLAKEGIKISWKGLEKSPVTFENTYTLAEPGRIAITVPVALSKQNRQSYDLWQQPNHPDHLVFSQIAIQYPKQFSLLYNCLAAGTEALLMAELSGTVKIDRPVTADNQRRLVTTDKLELLSYKLKDIQYLYLQGLGILDRLLVQKKTEDLYPVAFALSNALIKTTPVDEVYLLGIVENDRQLIKGALKLVAHIYQLLPSLPDPYVSSYSLPVNAGYNRKELYVRSNASALSGFDLFAIVAWDTPALARTDFGFSRTVSLPAANSQLLANSTAAGQTAGNPSATGQPVNLNVPLTYATYVNPIAVVRAEDAANNQGLINYFENAFGAPNKSNIYLLDVSTNADLMGVGFSPSINSDRKEVQASVTGLPFSIRGIDLTTYAINAKIYTLPQIQWEPIRTIQNPDVSPPFPSPATSPHTGSPTLMAIESYDLVPIAPLPVIDKFLAAYNDDAHPSRAVGLFNLPFGMKAAALWDNAKDPTKQGASIARNQPEFNTALTTGGIQIAIIASSPDRGDQQETPGFKGATIQTRNLIELLTGAIPVDGMGRPLSVLGPAVDIIFNAEFNPVTGAAPRVPVERIDISGYGASMFSNWLNPKAAIAATSQAKFDVWIGRTSHEVIQVKSILYPWGVPVVRTITIQRTSGSGVTRYDSGWKAQGPGNYDFSYYAGSLHVPTPFDFHPGAIQQVNNVTSIKDTGRIYSKPGLVPTDDVIMMEVFFDTDMLIENVQVGATNGYVPSKGQRGFVQLSPYQQPLQPAQFYQLLQEEGPLGGPLDCVVNIGLSGQTMRILRADVSGVDNMGGNYVFVSAGHGSVQLPREGSWSLVKRKENSNDIITIDQDAGLPLIREGLLGSSTTRPYRFSDPVDLLQSADPISDYGLLHSTGTQQILFLRPTIQPGDTNIKSTLQPYLADSFALVNSSGIFPDITSTFPLGATTGANLQIIAPGKLKLTSGGHYKAPPGYTRDIVHSGNSRLYVDYSDAAGSGDTSEVDYSFDSNAPVPWTATTKNHSLVVDLAGLNSLVTVTTEFDAAYGQKPSMPRPRTKFGSILQPIVDMLSFLGGQDIGQALGVSMSNLNTSSWQRKLQGIMEIEIEFKAYATAPPKFEVKIAHAGLDGSSPLPGPGEPEVEPLPVFILGCNIALKAYMNMLPQSLTATHRDGSPATPAELATATTDMISSGATLEIEGELHILCYTIIPNVAGVYFFGMLGFEFGIDSVKMVTMEFKIAVGLEVRAQWPVVGEVSVLMAVGLEMEWSSGGTGPAAGVFALIIFKGEAELLGGIIVIGIQIEAKGGVEKETNSSGILETYAVVEVEFAVEISLAFVIHFEFDETWQDKRQTA